MKTASVIKSLVSYFNDFEILEGKTVGVNQLDETANDYCIAPLESYEPVMKRYIDGASMKQYVFDFQSTKTYSMDELDTSENLVFYENFAEAVKEKNKKKELPGIEGIQSIETISNGYMIDINSGVAVYQIQMRIVYIEG